MHASSSGRGMTHNKLANWSWGSVKPNNRFAAPVGCQDVQVTIVVDIVQVNDVGPREAGASFVDIVDVPLGALALVLKDEHAAGAVRRYDHIWEAISVDVPDVETIRARQLAGDRMKPPAFRIVDVFSPGNIAAVEARFYTVEVTVSVDVSQANVRLRKGPLRKLGDPPTR